MATPLTLREKKFQNLLSKYHDEAKIIPLTCPGLVELIENTDFHGSKIKGYLDDLFSGVDIAKVGAIVLGCTHYLFIKDEIVALVGSDIALIDGNYGTAKHLYKTLSQNRLLSEPLLRSGQQVQFYSNGQKDLTLTKYEKFFDYAIQHIYPKQ
jgi:glutamate racemase